MRLIVFFDLPVGTALQRKNYRLFRKSLLKDGYIMMQQSVYCKMVIDGPSAESAAKRLKKNKPPQGLVQLLKVTEKQFASIKEITGSKIDSDAIDSMERLIIL